MEYVSPAYNDNPALPENTLRAHDKIWKVTYCSRDRLWLQDDPTQGVVHNPWKGSDTGHSNYSYLVWSRKTKKKKFTYQQYNILDSYNQHNVLQIITNSIQ